MHKTRLQLIRQSDGLRYTFARQPLAQGGVGYRREDAELWLRWRPGFGWGMWSGEDGALLGRPWDVPLSAQDAGSPPEGDWVSRKGAKSYVYTLAYL